MNNETIAIVTGASRGLGEAMALELLTRGTPVVAIARGASKTLQEHANQHNVPLFSLNADLSNTESITQTCASLSEYIPSNVKQCLLINNAGTVEPVSNSANITDAQSINNALMLNVGSIMMLCAATLKICQANNIESRILNISSGAGRSPMPGWAVYCATKAALDHYTRVLAQEHTNTNAKAVSIAPGIIDTSMQAVIRASDETAFPSLQNFINMHESGQLASAKSVASHIINYMFRDDFGNTVIDDIRNYY